MSFASSLGAFTNVAARLPDGERPRADAIRGLDLADREIQEVIDSIQGELDDLDPAAFETKGHISPVSFGGADLASKIAMHHSRAHAVTADTLNGVITDLETFRDACRNVRAMIAETDEGAADALNRTVTAVDTLEVAARTNQAQQTHEQAQQEHADHTPTEEPTEGDT